MSTLTYLSILNHNHNLQSMVTKLPFTLQDRWRREANKRRVAGGVIPSFADFVNFVNAEAGIATDPVFSREALRRLDGTSELIVSAKAEVKALASLKRLGTIMLLHIRPPVTRQM